MKKITIAIIALLFAGCSASKVDTKMYDLLYRGEVNNLVYKAPTSEDYKIEEYN